MRVEEKILKAMGEIEDDFIKEAAAFLPESEAQGALETGSSAEKRSSVRRTGNIDQKRPRRRSRVWRYGGALAACLVIAVVAWANLMPAEKEPGGEPLVAEEGEELPLLTIEEKQGDMQAENRTKKLPAKEDADKKAGSSPWAEIEKVEKLPVYSNEAYGAVVAAEDAETGADTPETGAAQTTVDRGALADQVVMKAAAVDLDVEPSEVTVDESGTAAGHEAGAAGHFVARAETEQGSIAVSLNNETLIRFAESVSLPEEYRVPADQRSKENMEAAAGWLLSEYQDLTGFAGSRASVEIYWQEDGQKWIISGCEKQEDTASQIVSYNLKRVFFKLDDAGNLSEILLRDYMACSEKIEEYPIITEDEARKLLEAGDYTTQCGAAMPGTSYIRRVNLVYLAGEQYNIFMPYYAFDVQLPEGSSAGGGSSFDEGLVDCGTYYVPAVKGEYIANMPKNKTE